MGVITKLTCNEINRLIDDTKIEFISIKETKNGITDSTYIGRDKNHKQYIFKVFETSTLKELKNEIHILNTLEHLKVPRVLSSKINLYKNKPTALFSFLEGKISKEITLKQIEDITLFLTNIHKIKDIKTTNENIYSKKNIETLLNTVLVDKTITNEIKNEFESRYSLIKDISLDNTSLIHGDLFPDNAKFKDESLSGVYGFGQSCFGNSYFDLAVLIISWCFKGYELNEIFFNKILDSYNKKMHLSIEKSFIKQYLLYASLFYSLQRFTRVNNLKDYKEFLEKFDLIESSF